MASSALKLNCQKCDGIVPICLIRNRQICLHCEQKVGIEAEVAKKLQKTREQLLKNSPQVQQLKAQKTGKYGPSLPAFLIAVIWGVVGG